MSESATGYRNLGLADRTIAEAATRPRWPVYSVSIVAIALGWVWLAFMADASSGGLVSEVPFLQWLAAICAPTRPATLGLATVAATFSMWMAMSVAMMLPSAAPLIRTYAEIADTAGAKGERVVSVLVLVAGYLTAWLAFSAAATLVQLGLVATGQAASLATPVSGWVAGFVLIGAGAYQFSALRESCLEKCRNPFATLFARWTDKPFGVWKLGIEQGAFCIGCCWALMLVMLVAGAMNLVWMVLLTLFAVLEKSGTGKVTSRVSGGILLAWGAGLIALQTVYF